MYFDWKRFCLQHSIPFVTSGPNTAAGNINIHCPFCGVSDPSQHLGLSLNPRKPYWGCWRNKEHRGKVPTYLIQTLLGCGPQLALSLIADGDAAPLDDFESTARDLLHPEEEEQRLAETLPPWPPQFKPITNTGISKRFYRYLYINRGFNVDLPKIIRQYSLCYALSGQFSWRILFPIIVNGELATWTGRDITGTSQLRYKTLSNKKELAELQGFPVPARINIKETLFNVDELAEGGEALVITEGPMDALKVDAYMRQHDVRGTCLFGKTVQPNQFYLLSRVARNFHHVYVMLDKGEFVAASQLAAAIAEVIGKPVYAATLTEGAKDPGDLSPQECLRYGQNFARGARKNLLNYEV
jgi:hypothetical protein